MQSKVFMNIKICNILIETQGSKEINLCYKCVFAQLATLIECGNGLLAFFAVSIALGNVVHSMRITLSNAHCQACRYTCYTDYQTSEACSTKCDAVLLSVVTIYYIPHYIRATNYETSDLYM